LCVLCYKGFKMFRNWLLFSVFLVLLQACQAESQKSVPLRGRDKKVAIKKQEKEKQSSSEIPKAQPEPEIIPPVPMPPYGPFDPMPYPYDPPGYISEPVITCVGPPDPLPRSIQDSIVIFPATPASFGSNLNDFNKYIDSKIVGTSEFEYLKEIGVQGRIFVRLLIDVKGQVRQVTFLKFTEKETEILTGILQKSLLTMPNWTPAKNEQGQAVVSEPTLPIRLPLIE